MRQGNRLQLEFVFLDYSNDAIGFVARIDTDRAPSLFTTDHAGLLLKCSDGYLFYNHVKNGSVVCRQSSVARNPQQPHQLTTTPGTNEHTKQYNSQLGIPLLTRF